MNQYYDSFCKLCDELAIKSRIDQILADLYARRDALEAVSDELKLSMVREHADVERLNEVNVTSIFYTVIGQKDKKLERERAEAFNAEEKFTEIQNQLAELDEEIRKYECELRTVRGCDLRYGRLLQQILDELKSSDSPDAKAVIDTVDSLTRIEEKVAKLDEAIELSRDALNNARDAAKYLAEADKYAQKLAYSNADHRMRLRFEIKIKLSEAQPIVNELCRQIKRLDASLVGSHIDFEIRIVVENYPDDISEWKAETDRLVPQIEKLQEKLIPARDRWANRVAELRIELQEQIKTALE